VKSPLDWARLSLGSAELHLGVTRLPLGVAGKGLRVAGSSLGVAGTRLAVVELSLGATESMLGMAGTCLCLAGTGLGASESQARAAGRAPGAAKIWACQAKPYTRIMRGTMTQDQDNIRTMFQTTIKLLDDYNAVWTGTAAFVDAVTRAKNGLTAIDTAADSQQTPITGVAADKAQARSDLEDQTLEIADQLAALAVKNGDHDLLAKVQTSKSALDSMKDNDLEATAERVANLANANIAALAAYGVTAAEVTALNTARTTLQGIQTSPRELVAGRKALTQSLSELIANVRSIFRNEIDKMMTPYKKSNPDFYNGYFAARVIVNRAATHAAPKKPTTPTPP